jgi:hypothetical protein
MKASAFVSIQKMARCHFERKLRNFLLRKDSFSESLGHHLLKRAQKSFHFGFLADGDAHVIRERGE